MSVFPLPPVPNFRVAQASPGHVRLNWGDYPAGVKSGHQMLGFRIYRSANKDELGVRIADESVLGPGVFQYDDTSPDAGPQAGYVCVALEQVGYGMTPFGSAPYGEPNFNGFSLLPYNTRPFGAPLKGWGEAPFGAAGYGF